MYSLSHQNLVYIYYLYRFILIYTYHIYIYIHCIYHILFIFHGLTTDPNSALSLEKEPQAARLDLTAVSYASALTACERVSLWEKAVELGSPRRMGEVSWILRAKMVMFMDLFGKRCGFSLILMGTCRFSWIFMGKNVDFHGFSLEIRPHRFGGEGVLIGGQQQH